MAQLTLFPLQYQRQDAVPIDIDMVFATTALRNSYLTSPRRHAGQIVADLELEKCYVLNTAKDTWLPIGPDVITSVLDNSTAVPDSNAVYDFVKTEIAALIDSSPETLNTLNEIAAALNNDPDFYNTITDMIALKADKTDIGDLVNLSTTDKTSIVAAINELYLSIENAQPVLSQDLTVQLGTGVTFGGVSTGNTFFQGSQIENLLRTLLIKAIPPTYVAPSLTLTTNVPVSTTASPTLEIGANITPTFNTTFNQNDGGTEISRVIRLNSVDLAGSSVSPFTAPQIQVTGSASVYQATSTYNQGACKNNNLGVLDCTGRINAGSVNSTSFSYTGFRRAFHGSISSGSVPNTSAGVRALPNSFLRPIDGSVFNMTIPAGTTSVIIAYPESLGVISSVKYVELSNSEIKGNFVQTVVAVEGANGFAAVNYYVYAYTPVEPFSQAVTYNVTI